MPEWLSQITRGGWPPRHPRDVDQFVVLALANASRRQMLGSPLS
jgi:hypothetical protein